MSATLGISCGYHDAAAALVVDGEIIAAMQEERFSRMKNDPSLPLQAMHACLKLAGIDARALDAVVFYENPYAKLERVLLSALHSFPRGIKQFPRAMASQLGEKLWVLDAIARTLGVPRDRVGFVSHHEAHAASAFFASPFSRAAVLTVDGVGEDSSTAIWDGAEGTLTLRESIAFPHSLGLLYAALTAYLGFSVNEGEYKVMGLAAYGKPRFREEFARIVHLHRDGNFSLTLSYFDAHTDTELGFGPALERLLGPRRPPHAPWQVEGKDQHYADIAATLQVVTEEALLGLARRAKALTGADALCMAGGVALNCVANRRLALEAGFTRMFVQPAAGDAGGALGAAMLRAGARPKPMASAALGLPIDAAEAQTLACGLGLFVERVSDPARAAAERMARGEIVAWATGRFEWGPRALGQRSLCALPAEATIRERINRVIKRREPFRPFAPAVLARAADRWFERFAPELAPYMLSVADVRSPLEAVTHVDGTARLQTVAEDGAFAPLLHALEDLGLPPIVLNTSLNAASEPMVARAADAVGFLVSHPIDALFVEDVCVRR